MSGLDFFYDPLGHPGDPQHVAPLFSQPLVEVALRIPTYVLMTSGRDRTLARLAFARDVAPQILRRHAKGGMEEHVRDILRRDLDFARSMLLDGMLVKERLLDRVKVEEALSGRPSAVTQGLSEIFHHLNIEVWARL